MKDWGKLKKKPENTEKFLGTGSTGNGGSMEWRKRREQTRYNETAAVGRQFGSRGKSHACHV